LRKFSRSGNHARARQIVARSSTLHVIIRPTRLPLEISQENTQLEICVHSSMIHYAFLPIPFIDPFNSIQLGHQGDNNGR